MTTNKDYDLYKNAFTQDFNTKIKNPTFIIIDNPPNKDNLSNWILDSGASIHVTCQKSLLSNIKPHSEPITIANNDMVYSTRKGNLLGYINNQEIKLIDVLYIPDFKRNIISLTKLTKQNYKIIFNTINNKSYAMIYTPERKRITSIPADEHNNTYQIWITNRKINQRNKENLIY